MPLDLRVVNSRLQLTFEGFGLRFLFEGRIVNVSAPVPDTVVDSASKSGPRKSNEVLCDLRP